MSGDFSTGFLNNWLIRIPHDPTIQIHTHLPNGQWMLLQSHHFSLCRCPSSRFGPFLPDRETWTGAQRPMNWHKASLCRNCCDMLWHSVMSCNLRVREGEQESAPHEGFFHFFSIFCGDAEATLDFSSILLPNHIIDAPHHWWSVLHLRRIRIICSHLLPSDLWWS